MRNRILPLFVLAFLGLAPALRAGDETPAARAQRVMAAFPEPSKDAGFAWDLDLVMGTIPLGSMKLAATAEEGHWKLEESAEVGPMKMKATGLADKSLVSQGGEYSETTPDKKEEVTWERTDEGYELEVKEGDGEPAEKTVKAPEGAVWGIAGAVLFCRSIPADKAEYAVTVLSPSPDQGEQVVEEARVRVEGAGSWEFDGKKTDAFLCILTKGEDVTTIALDPARKALVGAKKQKGEMAFIFLPKGAAKSAAFDFTKPAKTAQEAAAKVALGFGAGVKEFVEAGIHWPSAFDAMKASGKAGELADADTLKQVVLMAVSAHGPREMLEKLVGGMISSLPAEKLENGNTKVTFPPQFQSLVLQTREVDGAWYVVVLPD